MISLERAATSRHCHPHYRAIPTALNTRHGSEVPPGTGTASFASTRSASTGNTSACRRSRTKATGRFGAQILRSHRTRRCLWLARATVRVLDGRRTHRPGSPPPPPTHTRAQTHRHMRRDSRHMRRDSTSATQRAAQRTTEGRAVQSRHRSAEAHMHGHHQGRDVSVGSLIASGSDLRRSLLYARPAHTLRVAERSSPSPPRMACYTTSPTSSTSAACAVNCCLLLVVPPPSLPPSAPKSRLCLCSESGLSPCLRPSDRCSQLGGPPTVSSDPRVALFGRWAHKVSLPSADPSVEPAPLPCSDRSCLTAI